MHTLAGMAAPRLVAEQQAGQHISTVAAVIVS
jgi:hypothetical protein